MKAEEIKAAVDAGKKVHWSNKSYQVIKGKDDYLIKGPTGHAIGLTWEDGKTLNGKEEDFFLAEAVDLTTVPQKVADAIEDVFNSMKVRTKKVEVIRNDEPESFDVAVIYGDGKDDEFSFHVDPSGNLILSDFTFSKNMGKAGDSQSNIAKKIKDHFSSLKENNKPTYMKHVKLFEDFVNEGYELNEGRIALNHVYANAPVRNKVLEILRNGRVTEQDFMNAVSKAGAPSKWISRNSHFFKVEEEDGVKYYSLSKTGHVIMSAINESEVLDIYEEFGLEENLVVDPLDLTKDFFYVSINGKVYGYQAKPGGNIEDVATTFKKMLKYSAGKALAWLKKNTELALGAGGSGPLREAVDVKYWTDYHEGSSKITSMSKVANAVEDQVISWNKNNEDGKDNEIGKEDEKKVMNLAHDFFKAAGWISADIIQAMIAQT